MANTLTNLIPSLYAGLDMVSRELVGYIPAVRRDATADRAAVGQAVRYPITPAGNVSDITPAMTVPEPTDQTIDNGVIEITKSRAAEFGFVGESELGLNNNGPGVNLLQADMFAQGIRALTNEVENDLAVAAAAGASRAFGAVGTPPFASNINSFSQLGKILSDNGAPITERNLVLNTTAGADLRTLHGINADRDYSNRSFSEQGVLITPYGLATRETGQAVEHTAGDADSATTNAAGYAVGATVLTLASAGTGAILAGDVITLAGDTSQYVVTSGDTDVSDGGTITIAEPGLRAAVPASTTAITLVASYDVAGVAFYRGAIVLASRAPALPQGGDVASDRRMIVDPRSGLAMEVSMYPGYRKMRYEVALAWGTKVVQTKHASLLLA